MLRTPTLTFNAKLDRENFDIVPTNNGCYQVDYCGPETSDTWITLCTADTYEELAEYISTISEAK
jgi:hypothetical protein